MPVGVLHPGNLPRFSARLIEPAPDPHDVVARYWHVQWRLAATESIDQAVVDPPAVTLTIEAGDVPHGLVITGPHRIAWRRTIAGTGDVFGIRLRPGGLTALGTLDPASLVDRTVALTAQLDPALHALLRRVSVERSVDARVRAADALIGAHLRARPLTSPQLLANGAVEELRVHALRRTGEPLAERLGVSERTVQRALAATLGIGAKQAASRIRMQQAADAVALRGDTELAAIAAELGFTDQAHLTSEFRAVTGMTPGSYRRTLRRIAAG